ncbi:MAG: CbtA family protein [Janthinobacterium lividum]
MVRQLLIRGMLVGILAGLFGFGFAWLFGEKQIDLAVAFEDHVRQLAGEAPEPELVSRAVQSTVGLLTGMLVYGGALGGILSLVFAYVQGRVVRLSPRATSAILGLAGLVVLILVPQIKYPANPPSVGDPATIGLRTGLYFEMIALSVVAAVAGVRIARKLLLRFGRWNAVLAGVGVYVVAMAVTMLVLPPVDEVPPAFLAVTLWHFRLASFGTNIVVWTVLGLGFGALTERFLQTVPKGSAFGGVKGQRPMPSSY